MDRKTAQAVIDLAMRAGVAMLSTGAAAADVTATVLMLTRAYGLASVHVDVTYTSVTVSYHRGPDADPITVMRIVRFRVQDYTRLQRLRSLIVALSREPIDVDDARIRFDAVLTAPHPYRRWVVTGASATLAAGAAGLLGGGWFIVLLSFLTAALVTRVNDMLGKAGVASFFSQCVGAAIPTIVATLIVVGQSAGVTFFGDVSPSLVVASGIVLLLSGLSIVGAGEDALEGYYVTAGARAFEVVVLSLGIAVGVSVVLAVGQGLGYPIAISSRTLLGDNVLVQVACAVVIAVAFGVSSYSTGRAVTAAGAAAALGWVIVAVGERAEAGAVTSSALAALVIGFAARLVARRARISALAVTTAAIVPSSRAARPTRASRSSSRSRTGWASPRGCRRWPRRSGWGWDSRRVSRSAPILPRCSSPGGTASRSAAPRARVCRPTRRPRRRSSCRSCPTPASCRGWTRGLRPPREGRDSVRKHTAYGHVCMPLGPAGWSPFAFARGGSRGGRHAVRTQLRGVRGRCDVQALAGQDGHGVRRPPVLPAHHEPPPAAPRRPLRRGDDPVRAQRRGRQLRVLAAARMSVPDVSGKAIANLEIESLRHVAPTFHGDTIYGETTVLDKWESTSKDDRGSSTSRRSATTRTARSCASSAAR